jgi:hypothetical protein
LLAAVAVQVAVVAPAAIEIVGPHVVDAKSPDAAGTVKFTVSAAVGAELAVTVIVVALPLSGTLAGDDAIEMLGTAATIGLSVALPVMLRLGNPPLVSSTQHTGVALAKVPEAVNGTAASVPLTGVGQVVLKSNQFSAIYESAPAQLASVPAVGADEG